MSQVIKEISKILQKKESGSVVSENCFLRDKEAAFASRLLRSGQIFLKDPITFYLTAGNGDLSTPLMGLEEVPFSRLSEKANALETLRQSIELWVRSESLRGEIMLAADELFTNAVFNAPFQDSRGHKLQIIDRQDSLASFLLQPSARLIFGADEDRVVIACQDFYGTLRPLSVIDRIDQCYVKGVDAAMNWGKGGAGIGSFMVYNLSSTYILAVVSGQTTLVAAVFPRKLSVRKREQLDKVIHVFKEASDVKVFNAG